MADWVITGTAVATPSVSESTATLRKLADRSMRLYPPGNLGVSQGAYEIQAEQAFRDLVNAVGGIYTIRKSIALVDGQREYDLPDGFRQLFNQGVSISETAIDA